MPSETSDLLLEIGVEELPASFVDAALRALPEIAARRFAELRLGHGALRALGTPRRLALLVESIAEGQADLDEEVTGPPVSAAFKDGAPTRAAEAFAQKLDVTVDALRRVTTPKGEYLAGTRKERGRPALELLPGLLAEVIRSIPFRKSMRWGAGDAEFGRPVQWLVALLGEREIAVEFAGVTSGRTSRGHRFLAPGEVTVPRAGAYVEAMRAAHVLVVPEERARSMRERLDAAAREASGVLIEDEFLIGENVSLVEEPHVIVGGYDEEFLALPERVILEVARGHQRYFGVRGADGRLLPRYLAVVNTAERPENIRRGNDRVMRARLADARFFHDEDLKHPLAERRQKLAAIVFQKRLGSMLAKAERIERLARELGLSLMLPEPVVMAAAGGAHLAKCDLVTLMVGEFPELEGEMGRAYALAQGVSEDVASVIREHYQPRGASGATAPTDAGALVALADRLDTLAGCFAVGLSPTGAADPYGLRRACIGALRTVLDRGLDLRLSDAFRAAYDGFEGVALDLSRDELVAKLGDFFAERLRGLFAGSFPQDVVQACLAIAADRPLDARARAEAIAELTAAERSRVGEVFKRATNIASSAPPGEPLPPPSDAHASEVALYEGYVELRETLGQHAQNRDYPAAFRVIATFAPLLDRFFTDVYVMSDDVAVREGRLRLMRAISETCATLARLDLLGEARAEG